VNIMFANVAATNPYAKRMDFMLPIIYAVEVSQVIRRVLWAIKSKRRSASL
jgi:hypothetical protein